ncbi:MAG: ABC transporter permease [Gemmataceae bacterium]
MRFADILRMALAALGQQKVRTALTLLGVAVGSFVLVASLSIGIGVQDMILKEYRRNDQLRRITLWGGVSQEPAVPAAELEVQGEMDDAKRERLQSALRRRLGWKYSRPKAPLTLERLHELAQMDHVVSVFPDLYAGGRAILGKKTEEVQCTGIPADDSHFSKRLIAGAFLQSNEGRGVVVSEYLLYRMGITSESDVQEVLGKPVRLEFRGYQRSPMALVNLLNPGTDKVSLEESQVLEKVIRQLPTSLEKLDLTSPERDTLRALLKRQPVHNNADKYSKDFLIAQEFTIIGVVRDPTQEELDAARIRMHVSLDSDIILPLVTAEELFARMPYHATDGFNAATVTVDTEENVKPVVKELTTMGYNPFSLVEVLDRLKTNARLISLFTAFVAAIALLVACLGITNTMLMTVLERTHEIGVMKAVGAKNRHIELIFLVEGAALGVLGGCLGLLLAWLASFPGNAIAQSIIEKETQTQIQHHIFVFPLWLTLGIPLFAAVVTTIAALYPARRAARINPILALRHE